MKIKLSNGEAEIRDSWKWKHEKKYMGELLKADAADRVNSGAAFMAAKETLVSIFLITLKTNNQDFSRPSNGDFPPEHFDEMNAADFEKIFQAGNKIREDSILPESQKKT